MNLSAFLPIPAKRAGFVMLAFIGSFLYSSCTETSQTSAPLAGDPASTPPVAPVNSSVRTQGGLFIGWKEHRIDDPAIGGVEISGGDGLLTGDLDNDGHLDVVSVHESDTEYDGVSRGHIRIAFGSADPDKWELVTLAEGPEAGAAEDVDLADANGDGYLDIVAACEIEHLIYFQNPGRDIRSSRWDRVIPPVTAGRGSWVRVFFADFDQDGKLEVVAPNKGSQTPGEDAPTPFPISWFELPDDPLDGANWKEHRLATMRIPENAKPIDLDGDGDLDIVGASRGEERILWFENLGGDSIAFEEHAIRIGNESESFPVRGVNMDFVDLSGDGKLDIVLFDRNPRSTLIWIEQPTSPQSSAASWALHRIGTVKPDALIGIATIDIDGDGDVDAMTGTYSGGPRGEDGADITAEDSLGRIAWFENPGDPFKPWIRHDIVRRKRGMFDMFSPTDLDGDGDVDFISTRGNSRPYDGVFWLEQIRSEDPVPRFVPARETDSELMPPPYQNQFN